MYLISLFPMVPMQRHKLCSLALVLYSLKSSTDSFSEAIKTLGSCFKICMSSSVSIKFQLSVNFPPKCQQPHLPLPMRRFILLGTKRPTWKQGLMSLPQVNSGKYEE